MTIHKCDICDKEEKDKDNMASVYFSPSVTEWPKFKSTSNIREVCSKCFKRITDLVLGLKDDEIYKKK